MPFSDFLYIFQWWITLFIIGIIFLPLTSLIFHSFFDKGYIFAKVIGIAVISYLVFVLGILKMAPFTEATIFLVSGIFLFINIFILVKVPPLQRRNLLKSSWKMFIFEEVLFSAILLVWSFIHAHGPDIHGLEKYMDFGFINSILRAEYFPPLDMWFTPFSINYYYFGHLTTAVLTKLSNLPSSITFNLMLATISAFIFTGAFSIGANLVHTFLASTESQKKHKTQKFSVSKIFSFSVVAGFLSGLIVTFAGNLHSIYTLFKPYENESPVPFWQLVFSPFTIPNSYWYPNATRFIGNTIHEFPIYSFVVSDLHGHVLDIPFVLLTIAVLLSFVLKSQIANRKSQINSNLQNSKPSIISNSVNWKLFRIWNLELGILVLLGFILAIMYMTNAWDGIIYLGLASLVLTFTKILRLHHAKQLNITNKPILQILPINKKINNFKFWILNNWVIDLFIGLFVYLIILGAGLFLFSLPFNLNFKPFASGIGVLCSPEFLTKMDKVGPFLFEENHCERSPIWQLLILYGFFYFWVVSFIIMLFKIKNPKREYRLSSSDIFILILISLSTLLIIIPEFVYVKDIYPAHYRANTMFKLVYQSFIMLSISSSYIVIRLFLNHKSLITNRKFINLKFIYWFVGFIGLSLVFIYPYLAINSYFGDLKTYYGLDGTRYLNSLYPTDYESILWINKNIKAQPVILEAQGDSYTDYGRISTNTGLPTVLGWAVHEWLWRGTYDVPSPRIAEVQSLYESSDIELTKNLISKYNVSLIFIGNLERQKYPNLNEEKFEEIGKAIYSNGQTRIYKIN